MRPGGSLRTTAAEPFAPPVGQRIVGTPTPWWDPEHGEVGGNDKTGLLILWPDGGKPLIAPSDDDVAEFPANLEVVAAADEPVVITRPTAPAAGCLPRASAPPA
jgi:hypothetical protein